MHISTCAGLQNISSGLSSSYQLDADIDCTGTSFSRIGGLGSPFRGVLNGQNHVVSHLTIIDNGLPTSQGVFSTISGATVENLVMSGTTISAPSTGDMNIGVLAGNAYSSTIENVGIFNASLTAAGCGNCKMGGLIGYSQATSMSGVYVNMGSISAPGSSNVIRMGGLVGELVGGSVLNAYTSGLTLTGGSNLSATAGIAADVTGSGSMTNVYAADSIVGNGDSGTSSIYGGLFGDDIGGCYLTNAFTSPSFSNLGGAVMVLAGAAIGSFQGHCNVTDVYYNSKYSGLHCDQGGALACNEVDNDEANFYDSANAPLSSWDFSGVWHALADNFPELLWNADLSAQTPAVTFGDAATGCPLMLSVDYSLPESYTEDSIQVKFTNFATSKVETVTLVNEPSATFSLNLSDLNYDPHVKALSGDNVVGPGTVTTTFYYTDAHGNRFFDDINAVTVPASSCTPSDSGNGGGGGGGGGGERRGGSTVPAWSRLSSGSGHTAAPVSSGSTLTSLQERTCKRVLKWFRGKALDRVNARLEKRLGFMCLP